MKKIPFILFGALLIACGGEEETSTNESNEETTDQDTSSIDTTVVIKEETFYFEDYAEYNTKTALYEAYDAENLKDEEAWYAEGTVKMETTMLTDPSNGNIIQFTWKEDDPEKLSFIETWNNNWRAENPVDQKVETREGLYTGMPLTELLEWNNGEDFDFSGFGWDYAGGVFEKEGSKLAKSKINVTLTMLDAGYETHLNLLGDMQFNTADEEVQGAPIVIGTITYYTE